MIDFESILRIRSCTENVKRSAAGKRLLSYVKKQMDKGNLAPCETLKKKYVEELCRAAQAHLECDLAELISEVLAAGYDGPVRELEGYKDEDVSLVFQFLASAGRSFEAERYERFGEMLYRMHKEAKG